MKKRLFSLLTSVGMAIILTLAAIPSSGCSFISHASSLSAEKIQIDNEYMIPDSLDWCTYYVVVATNKSGRDIMVSADFSAFDKNGKELAKVNDYFEAVKNNQQFILYGQFLNAKIKNASKFNYTLKADETDNCTYSSVDVDAVDIGECLQVSATNYSEKDIQGVGVRTVFLRGNKAVAFDTVNIADSGYVFHGGSTNSQIVGYNAGKYDKYIITYTSAGKKDTTDF